MLAESIVTPGRDAGKVKFDQACLCLVFSGRVFRRVAGAEIVIAAGIFLDIGIRYLVGAGIADHGGAVAAQGGVVDDQLRAAGGCALLAGVILGFPIVSAGGDQGQSVVGLGAVVPAAHLRGDVQGFHAVGGRCDRSQGGGAVIGRAERGLQPNRRSRMCSR